MVLLMIATLATAGAGLTNGSLGSSGRLVNGLWARHQRAGTGLSNVWNFLGRGTRANLKLGCVGNLSTQGIILYSC